MVDRQRQPFQKFKYNTQNQGNLKIQASTEASRSLKFEISLKLNFGFWNFRLPSLRLDLKLFSLMVFKAMQNTSSPPLSWVSLCVQAGETKSFERQRKNRCCSQAKAEQAKASPLLFGKTACSETNPGPPGFDEPKAR